MSNSVKSTQSAEKTKDVEPREGYSIADTKNAITVYKKKSTFKGAKEDDFYYSATRTDGHSLILKFKFPMPEPYDTSTAFIISNVVGNCKRSEKVVKGETYTNFTYYITECDFDDIEGEPLPL